ncbi:MAG: sensor histidine kinase [Lachnospiraceae bacterium]
MKRIKHIWMEIRKRCREYGIFFILLLVMDVFTGGFLWLMNAKAFHALSGMFFGVSVGLFAFGVWYCVRREKRMEEQLEKMLMDVIGDEPVQWQELPFTQLEVFLEALDKIRELLEQQKQQVCRQREYEDYIENWAHEIKVPLSLLTLVLDNRREDMSPAVYEKMNYVNRRVQEYVTQILYYARLKAVHKDYVMEWITLKDICLEAAEEYAEYMTECGIELKNNAQECMVLTDRKGIHFILGQVLNNACKYMDDKKEQSYIEIKSEIKEERIWLQIADNGVGVAMADLPFLFDKGFTGRTIKSRTKATGMGLYLVAEMAKDLSVELCIDSKEGDGFMIRMGFPVVDNKDPHKSD